jgi:predicted nucleotidyltransferase
LLSIGENYDRSTGSSRWLSSARYLGHEASEVSDVDLLVEFDRPVSLFDLPALELFARELLGVSKVDVVMRDSIYPAIKEDILKEAIRVN